MYSNNYGDRRSLFNSRSFHEFQEDKVNRLKSQIEDLDPEDLRNEETKKSFVTSATLTVPTVDWSKTSIIRREEKVQESHDQVWGYTSHKVTVCTFGAPFSGDGHLFQIQPTQRRLSHEQADIGHNGSITFELTADDNAEQNKAALKRVQDNIDFNLEHLKKDIAGFNSSLESTISKLFEQRAAELEKHSSNIDSFGVPIKGA